MACGLANKVGGHNNHYCYECAFQPLPSTAGSPCFGCLHGNNCNWSNSVLQAEVLLVRLKEEEG
jgi:hypothetical protein